MVSIPLKIPKEFSAQNQKQIVEPALMPKDYSVLRYFVPRRLLFDTSNADSRERGSGMVFRKLLESRFKDSWKEIRESGTGIVFGVV